jgi:hypothetical protein
VKIDNFGKQTLQFSISVYQKGAGRNNQVFYQCYASGNTLQFILNSFKRGEPIEATGVLKETLWNGNKIYNISVERAVPLKSILIGNYQQQPNNYNNQGYQQQPNKYNNQGYQQQPNNYNNQGYQQQPNNYNNQGYQQQPNNYNNQGYQQQPNNYNNQGYQQQPNNYNNQGYQQQRSNNYNNQGYQQQQQLNAPAQEIPAPQTLPTANNQPIPASAEEEQHKLEMDNLKKEIETKKGFDIFSETGKDNIKADDEDDFPF